MSIRARVATVLSSLLLLTAPAAAVTINSTTIETDASITAAGSDPQGPANSGSLFSEVVDSAGSGIDFNGDAFARAAQNVDGFGAVATEGLYASPPGRIVLESQSTWTQTAEITGGTSEDLSIVLSITAPQLLIQDFANVGVGPNETITEYALELTLDGSPIFGSSATFRGGRAGNTLTETGTDLGGTFFSSGSIVGYDFDPLITSVSLGTFAPGETLEVEYTMRVLVNTPQLESGGRATIGDPLDLSGDDVVAIKLVPEPATGALLAIALLGLAASRRRSG